MYFPFVIMIGWTFSADYLRCNSVIVDLRSAMLSLMNYRFVFCSVMPCVILVRNLSTLLFVVDICASKHDICIFLLRSDFPKECILGV